jgi:hypothetical protein
MSEKAFTKKELEQLIEDGDETVKFMQKKQQQSQVNGSKFTIIFSSTNINNILYLVIHVKSLLFVASTSDRNAFKSHFKKVFCESLCVKESNLDC